MKKILRRILSFSLTGKLSLIVIGFFIILAIFPWQITFHPHNYPSGPPLEPPSKEHWLGTDDLGIDIWAQICYGARVSITIGVITAFISVITGGLIGICGGYYGGKIDNLIIGFIDLMMVIPQLPMMIVLGSFWGPSIKNIILVLIFFSWTTPARIIRSKVLSIKEEKFILVAKSYGAGLFYITKKHILPQILPLMLISFIQLIGKAMIAEAGLSFLGLGDPTSKSWGLMLNHAISFRGIYFTDFWKWWVTSPLISIVLFILSVAFLGKEIERKEVMNYGKHFIKS